MTKLNKPLAVAAILTSAVVGSVGFSLPSNSQNAIKIVSFIGAKPIEVKDEDSSDYKPVEIVNDVFVDNSIDRGGNPVSKIGSSGNSEYKIVKVLPSVTLIAQTSDTGNIQGGLSIERIRACLNYRPQLYTLATVVNAKNKEITVAVPLKFNGKHGTIQLNASGRPICPA